MKPRFKIWTIVLVAVIAISACAPALPTASSAIETPTSALSAVETIAVETPTPASSGSEAPQPVATSRGPNLEATDPTTVELASGSLQLVEFFRFT